MQSEIYISGFYSLSSHVIIGLNMNTVITIMTIATGIISFIVVGSTIIHSINVENTNIMVPIVLVMLMLLFSPQPISLCCSTQQ